MSKTFVTTKKKYWKKFDYTMQNILTLSKQTFSQAGITKKNENKNLRIWQKNFHIKYYVDDVEMIFRFIDNKGA